MKPSKLPSPAGRKFDSTTRPSPGRSAIARLGSAIERFATMRTIVPQSAAPHGLISTSALPLAVSQRPSIPAAEAAPAAKSSSSERVARPTMPTSE